MRMMRLCCFVLCSLWCLPLLANSEPPSKLVNNKEPLKIVTVRVNPPFSFELPDGSMSGYYVEFWRLWSETNNIPVQFISAPLLDTLNAIKTGQADFHTGLFISDERLKYGVFSQPIHRVSTGVFFTGDVEIPPLLRQLKNKKVGVQVGSFQEAYLRNNYKNLAVVTFDEAEDIIRMLLNNDIDAIVSEIPYFDAELGKMGLRGVFSLSDEKLLTNDVHAFIPKNKSELAKIINQGIQKIPLSKLIDLEQKWLPVGSNFYKNIANIDVPSLSLNEQQWLLQNQTFTLGVDPGWSPFEFINDDGQYSGIVSEYVDVIQNKLSIELVPDNQKMWSDALDLAKTGKIDILTAIVRTKERESYLNFTQPYLSFPAVITTRKEGLFVQNIDDLSSKRVAVVKGYAVKSLLEDKHPEITLVDVASVIEGLNLLERGEVDALIDNLAVITHEINHNNLNNLKVAAFTPYKFELSMGVRKGLEPLVPILNKVLATINSKMKTKISNNWLALKVNVGTELKTILMVGLPVVAGFLIIILFVIRANRRMVYEISARKKVEKSLESAKHIAESANLAKDEFLANMSHEIRTPMNAVVGMSHLLEKSGLNEEQKEYIEALNNSASSLLLLIDGILDLSKIESGKLDLEIVPFNLDDILKNVMLQTELAIDKEKIELIKNASHDIPNILLGDPLRLGQILLNLTNNAIKFTERGEIVLTVDVTDKTPDTLILEFSIRDTGIGISEEQQKKLFRTYSQADSSTTRKYGGTGLGLAICKKLCEKMHGQIWVNSEINKGSNFHFTVSFGYQEKMDANLSPAEGLEKDLAINTSSSDHTLLKDRCILIVDDNNINLMIARKVLLNAGVKVKTAQNGAQAIDMIKLEKFDAVLMDIQMPIMDGYSATRKLRSIPKFKKLPIIAMSANAMPEDIDNSLKSGMNAHVAKPIKIDLLLTTLCQHIDIRPRA